MASKKSIIGAAGAGSSLVAIVVAAILPHIQQFEGERHVPYRDITGVLTVCNGHTGPDVRPNTYYTVGQCASLANSDVTKAASGVLKVSPNLETHPMQLAAAISFSYNIGIGGYAKSSVAKDFNAGNFRAGCTDLLKYTYAGGKYSLGLANRRQAEYKICMSQGV